MYFEQERIGEVSVRGLADSILLYKVVKEASVTLNRVELVDPGNLTPLVGRDTELSILKDRWEQATEEMGQIVLLIGEAGLGKSRLIREIREHVSAEGDEPDIIELRCSQHHQSAGLYPMVEHLTKLLKFEEHSTSESRVVAIERYLDGLRLRSDRNVSLLAGLLNIESEQLSPLDVSPQRKRELTAAFLLELLKQRAEFHPVLFIVEDLHWVDPTLLELLSAYVEEFDQSRVLSIFTFRPEFETPWRSKQHQTQIALNRLSRKQIRDMMHKRFGRTDLPDVVVEIIVERTDGIPLFIEEFSNILAESGSLESDSISEDLLNQIIPASLQDLLMARLDRMSSNPEVIQLASAIGREFSFPLLRAASDLPEDLLQDELNKLAEAQVLFQKGKYPDASFIFKHALIQDSAYNSLLKKRRQEIHSRIGTALEASFPDTTNHQPELLAHHFTKANETEKAVDYWLKAGQRSQALFANLEAIGHYRNGLKVIETLEESGERDQMENNFQLSLVTV
ncbi:MAG TPA: AAA family ATPase, partial [Planctomycetaceae bacterium]|nr:AAA family ATPase [Planctomycetaceae bacterium]